MQLEQLTDVTDVEQPSVTVTNGRASKLYRKVREHGVSSLSPEELAEWQQVELVLARQAANPAYQRQIAAVNRQYPAYVKAERILKHLSPHERDRFMRWTPSDILRFFAASRKTPAGRSKASRPGRRSRSSTASRDGPDEPPPPLGGRNCGFCGTSLEGRRPNVKYCTPSHRARACQLRSEERRALKIRLTAALEIVNELGREERYDLLAAVVWPRGRLLEMAAA
jgi:hypothetical protein